MPSKPKPKRRHAHLHRWARIDRESALHSVRIQLGAAVELLDIDADYGLHLLQQGYTLRVLTRKIYTSWTALLLMHRAIELLDGISVLVKAGCVVPAVPLYRSMLEAVMCSRYLMVVNDERIAAAHVVSQLIANQLRAEEWAAQHAPGSRPTIIGRQGRRDLDGLNADDRIFREAKREMERLNAENSVPVPWYQAFGGPRTLGGLSRRLNDPFMQEMFDLNYDVASAAAHVADTTSSLDMKDDDPDNIADLFVPVRMPRTTELVNLVMISHALFMSLFRYQMEYFQAAPTGFAEYCALAERLGAILEQ